MILSKIAALVLAWTAVTSANVRIDIPIDIGHYDTDKPLRCADVDCAYHIRTTGSLNTGSFELYLENAQGVPISIFHDLPFHPISNNDPNIFNMFVEIPRWEIAKNEMNKETTMNPIKQDIKNGAPRFIPNIFPVRGTPANYGAIPQTWEDPQFVNPTTHTKGDNDPIDVVELSETPGFVGQVKQVKILGALALVDVGETDWKVIAIDIRDPMAPKLNNMDDVAKYYPGLQDSIRDWYRDYKIPDTGKQNEYGFGGRYLDTEYTLKIIRETNDCWRALINGTTTEKGEIKTATLTNQGSPYKVGENSPEVRSVPENDPQPATPPPQKYQRWTFIGSEKTDQSPPF
ncbi:inorganic pyrophosphatase [Fennellomyces sp. T-0311]|nr:inorganic pyrophosphatase [Fennellomyces sp. T-0311]